MRLPYKFGRYTLVEKIALGGTAEIYRAVLTGDSGFAKTVAIKCLHPSWGGNDEVRSMLADEARVLTHLEHHAIAQVFEFGHFEGRPYLVMEFVDGIDLERLLTESIREKSPIPTPLVFHIVSQILIALDFAHRTMNEKGEPLGIVHRDISPSNILLSWNGEVKVTDFGIAKGLHRTRGTAVGQLRGKYAYMAPEQACGKKVDPRSDIFACGIILFEMLTARRLFAGDSDFAVLENVKDAAIPADAMRELEPALREILVLALAHDPENRFQSAAEMLERIRSCANLMSGIGSSIELSKYLKDRFGSDAAVCRRKEISFRFSEQRRTEVMKHSPRKVRIKNVGHIAAIAVCLTAAALLPPESVTGNVADEVQGSAVKEEPRQVRVKPEPLPSAGSIAIDTMPSGAKGILTLNAKDEVVKTPIRIENIEIGGGVDAAAKFSLPDFESESIAFRLTQENPAFVKVVKLKKQAFAKISVQARPWGIVDIEGVVSGRESPILNMKIREGNYLVRVRHPPSGKIVKANVTVAPGGDKRCVVNFETGAAIVCR